MNFDYKTVRIEEYVSPSVDQTMVDAEKGFCASTATHDAFGAFDELGANGASAN